MREFVMRAASSLNSFHCLQQSMVSVALARQVRAKRNSRSLSHLMRCSSRSRRIVRKSTVKRWVVTLLEITSSVGGNQTAKNGQMIMASPEVHQAWISHIRETTSVLLVDKLRFLPTSDRRNDTPSNEEWFVLRASLENASINGSKLPLN